MASFKKCNWKSSQRERRAKADVMHAASAERSYSARMALIKARPGNSAREAARLEKALARRTK